jgi:hypothetical protein
MQTVNTVILGIMLWVLLLGIAHSSHAIVITSPQDGARFKEGDTVTVVAELSPGDPEMLYVRFFVTKAMDDCGEITTHPRYECTFTIPPGSPSVIQISAGGKGRDTIVESQTISISVTLPPTVTLQGLKSALGNKLFLVMIGENEQLYIKGVYSDGVERDLSSALTGTTYTSSDEKVVTIDKDGLVTAKSVGTARITVKNSKHELVVEAEVKDIVKPRTPKP